MFSTIMIKTKLNYVPSNVENQMKNTIKFVQYFCFLILTILQFNSEIQSKQIQQQQIIIQSYKQYMPKSERSQSLSVHSQTGLRLNQTEKMQHQADYYTKKYEWQKRYLKTLKGVESSLQNEVVSLKNSVVKLKKQSEEGSSKVMFTKIRNFHKQVDINDKKYNDTVGEIDILKRQIDLLRQQKTMHQTNLKKLQNDIQKADSEITQLMSSIQQSQNTNRTSQNMMLNLKLRNQQQKTSYYKKLNSLNHQLKDPKINKVSRLKPGQKSTVQNDTATILKQRLTKLIINNKEKVKLIDQYQRYMKVIDQAFNTIKEATGLTDIQQIQNTFIKGQQQNYNLLSYVDILNQQIDTLQDANEALRQKNKQIRQQNAEKQRILSDTPDEQKKRKKMQQYIASKKKQIYEFQSILNQIQPNLKEVLMKLAGSKFNRDNPHRIQQYQTSGVALNDGNLREYLSELQQYTNAILLYRNRANNLPNSSLVVPKTLFIDELMPKQPKKKDNSQLNLILEDTRDKTRGFDKILDKEQIQDMAKKQLEKGKTGIEFSSKGKKK